MDTDVNVKYYRENKNFPNIYRGNIKDIANIVSNDVYLLIHDYVDEEIPVPENFSLHICGMYARKRLPHWNHNGKGCMHLDATNLKEIIEEWINGPYMDKLYICSHDIDSITQRGNRDYVEGEAYKIAKEYGIEYDYSISSQLRKYLKETLPKTKVNFNGVKGITLYDATNLKEIITDFLKENYLSEKTDEDLER